jgi:hypothetical protein
MSKETKEEEVVETFQIEEQIIQSTFHEPPTLNNNC